MSVTSMYSFHFKSTTYAIYPKEVESLGDERANNSSTRQRHCATSPFCLLNLTALTGQIPTALCRNINWQSFR